jgi:hypothetical protein
MSTALLQLDRQFAELRVALLLAALVRETQAATLRGSREDVPSMIELIRTALNEAKRSKIASYVALDPVAREALAFITGESDPPVVPPASELSKTMARVIARMLQHRRHKLSPCVITDREEIDAIETSLRELGELTP